MSSDVLSETRVSKGFLTVVPSEVRRVVGVREGDRLEWGLRGTEIIVHLRKRKTIEEIVGLGKHGGDAVASKRAVQGMRTRVR